MKENVKVEEAVVDKKAKMAKASIIMGIINLVFFVSVSIVGVIGILFFLTPANYFLSMLFYDLLPIQVANLLFMPVFSLLPEQFLYIIPIQFISFRFVSVVGICFILGSVAGSLVLIVPAIIGFILGCIGKGKKGITGIILNSLPIVFVIIVTDLLVFLSITMGIIGWFI